VRIDLMQQTIKNTCINFKNTPFVSIHSDQLRVEQVVLKNCIAMLRRLCIIVQRRAITLTYYFEAAGSRRPGGIMVLVFLCVLLVLFVVLCTK
jgi:hypothetical protein